MRVIICCDLQSNVMDDLKLQKRPSPVVAIFAQVCNQRAPPTITCIIYRRCMGMRQKPSDFLLILFYYFSYLIDFMLQLCTALRENILNFAIAIV